MLPQLRSMLRYFPVRKTLIPARGRKPELTKNGIDVIGNVRKTLIPARGRKLPLGQFVLQTVPKVRKTLIPARGRKLISRS